MLKKRPKKIVFLNVTKLGKIQLTLIKNLNLFIRWKKMSQKLGSLR